MTTTETFYRASGEHTRSSHAKRSPVVTGFKWMAGITAGAIAALVFGALVWKGATVATYNQFAEASRRLNEQQVRRPRAAPSGAIGLMQANYDAR